MMLNAMLLPALLTWTSLSPPLAIHHRAARASICMKSAPDAAPEERPEINIRPGAICEFHDPKHGAGKQTAVLGVVKEASYKSKGGARLTIVDANGIEHQAVRTSDVHIDLGVYKGKQVEPSAILQDYEKVMNTEPTELGVAPEDLAMAWELCAEDDHSTFSPKFIINLVDEKMGQMADAVAKYKAFRLLTSDLGKIFFKPLNDRSYKAKAAKAVETSKQQWCQSDVSAEFCLV
jgi:hypothetical protein